MTNPEFHPLAAIFPMLSAAETKILAADIKANGLHEPVTLLDGMIIDGRNRAAACEMIDVVPEYISIEFADDAAALSYIISKNLRRRNLTGKQKRDVAAELLKVNPAQSDRAIADIVGISPTTAGKVRADLEEAGEVSKLDTHEDRKGNSRPAHKPVKKTPVAGKPAAPAAEPPIEMPAASAPAPAEPPTRPAEPKTSSKDAHQIIEQMTGTYIKMITTTLRADDAEVIIACLLNQHADALLEIVRHPKFGPFAAAVMAKLNAVTVSEQAERDNSVPADISGKMRGLEMAALDEAGSPPPPPSDKDLDIKTFKGGVLAAIAGKRA